MPPKYDEDDVVRLQADLELFNKKVAEREEGYKLTHSRMTDTARLKREIETIEDRIATNKEYLQKAEEEMRDFPTESDLQRLRDRLAKATEGRDEAEYEHNKRTTGIDAYGQRRRQNLDTILNLFNALTSALDDMLRDVDPRVDEEERVKSVEEMVSGIDDMLEIDSRREDHLQSVLMILEGLLKDESRYAEEGHALRVAGAEELPAIEQQRNGWMRDIEQEWFAEREHLVTIYERLLTLNKEQYHHLTRGTHIKRSPQMYTDVTLATLNSQNARLSNEATACSAQLSDLKEDLIVVSKHSNKTRELGREQQAAFEQRLEEKQLELEAANQALQDAKDEGNDLRNLRAELQQALHDMRDSKTLMMANTFRRK